MVFRRTKRRRRKIIKETLEREVMDDRVLVDLNSALEEINSSFGWLLSQDGRRTSVEGKKSEAEKLF